MKLEKISDRVFANTEGKGGGNAGIIVLDNQTVVVDAMYTRPGEEFRRAIEETSPKATRYLLLTHSHRDHVFGNQAFRDCEVVAHASLKARMQELLKTEWSPEGLDKYFSELRETDPERLSQLEGVEITLPTKTFDRRFVVEDDELTVEMEHVGGHTVGSSIVYFPREATLFTGDLVFAKTFPWGGDPTADPNEWMEALRKMLEMRVDVIIPGHGPICDKEEVEAYLRFFEEVKEKMGALMAQGKPEEEITNYENYPAFYGTDRANWPGDSLKRWYEVWRED
ncbi:MAG: MBL fold metallo-hydrolase [Candidatus Geothermarchaeales archaeon]